MGSLFNRGKLANPNTCRYTDLEYVARDVCNSFMNQYDFGSKVDITTLCAGEQHACCLCVVFQYLHLSMTRR